MANGPNTREFWLSKRLFPFGDGEWWRIADSVEGAGVLGGTGVGKTTGSGATLATSFLRESFGALVLTAKPEELPTWCDFLSLAGRPPSEDLVVLEPSVPHAEAIWPSTLKRPSRAYRFNLLEYHYKASGRQTSSLVDLFRTAIFRSSEAESREPFWGEAVGQMLTNTVDLVTAGTELACGEPRVRIDDLMDVIETAPVSRDDIDSTRFKSGRCYELLRTVDEGRDKLSEARFLDLQRTSTYWLREFAGLAEKVRSIVVTSFTAKSQALLRSPLRDMFCTETDSEVSPERTFTADPCTGRPKVLVLNLPVKLYEDVGQFAQVLYKTVWQYAAERRIKRITEAASDWRPSTLWADEAQHFVTKRDAVFQATARSAMVATVYLTQNLPALQAAMGETAAKALLGLFQTKIFHANGDPMTNDWAQSLFAQELQPFSTNPLSGQGSSSESISYGPVVPAIRFSQLKKGGRSSDPRLHRRVGAYIFQAGRPWQSKRPERHYHEFVQPE